MSLALRSISESATAEGVRRFLARHQSAMAVVADNRPLVRRCERRGQELRERARHTRHEPHSRPQSPSLQIAHETHDQLSTLVVALSGKSKKASRGALLSSSASASASARKRQRGRPPPPRLLPRTRSRPATPRRRARRRRRRARRRRRTPRETSSFTSSGHQQWISGPPKAHLPPQALPGALPTRLSAAGCS
jgi:hypothetical protein